MRRMIATTALLVAGAIGLSGCATAGFESSMAPAPDYAPMESGAYPAADAEAGGAMAYQSAEGREVITRGSLTVTVEAPNEAADEVARLVNRVGGHVAQRYEVLPRENQPGRASLVLRIPSAGLGDALEQIKALGEPRDINIGEEDVTMVVRDLDSRITAMQTSVDRLIALLAQADKTSDLIEIESALSSRQGELESMLGQRRALQDQVSLSTIQLELIGPDATPVDEPSNFLTGLAAGWNAFVAFWSAVVVALGVLLPWIILLGVLLTALIWWLRRRSRRAARGPVAHDAPVPAVAGTVAGAEPAAEPAIAATDAGAAPQDAGASTKD